MSTANTQEPIDAHADESAQAPPSSSRRGLMLGTAGAAAAVAVGLVGSRTAQAADGDAVLAGRENFASTRTELQGPSFVVTDLGASGSLAREVQGVVTGVHGFTASSTADRAVWGLDQTPGGVGVYGQHAVNGVGVGVVADSDNGVGLQAAGTSYDAQLLGTGQLNMVAAGPLTASTPGAVGTLARADDGTLWYSVADGEWSRVASRTGSSTFTAIEPTRVYDSRLAEPEPGALPVGGQRLVGVRNGRNLFTGAITEIGIVPDDATAITYNVTIDRTIGTGFLTVAPGFAVAPKASTINWSESGQTIANAGTVQVDRFGIIKVFVDGPGGGTDFIIDVTGYHA